MPIPLALQDRLKLPAIAAPMFLTSGPDLVVEVSRSGLIGTFPALNCRSNDGLRDWLDEIGARLGPQPLYGVNYIVHRTNPRREADLQAIVDHRVPLVITSLGAVAEVVAAVQGYGGLVFHDVISRRHAEKAAAAGVDGIIAVAAGAGGHAGTVNPFALVAEIRQVFGGTIILGGAINTGAQILAARAMGADLAYLGTRFIATPESMAVPDYKQMIVDANIDDLVVSAGVTGTPASWLKPSLRRVGLDPDAMPPKPSRHYDSATPGPRQWKDVWGAGQGVGAVKTIEPVSSVVATLSREYDAALARMASLTPKR